MEPSDGVHHVLSLGSTKRTIRCRLRFSRAREGVCGGVVLDNLGRPSSRSSLSSRVTTGRGHAGHPTHRHCRFRAGGGKPTQIEGRWKSASQTCRPSPEAAGQEANTVSARMVTSPASSPGVGVDVHTAAPVATLRWAKTRKGALLLDASADLSRERLARRYPPATSIVGPALSQAHRARRTAIGRMLSSRRWRWVSRAICLRIARASVAARRQSRWAWAARSSRWTTRCS